jgi:hypothetical protein
MRNRRSLFTIVFFLFATCGPSVWGQDGLGGALSRNAEQAHFKSSLERQIVAGDFDKDRKADGAILLDAGEFNGEKAYRIEIHLTATQNHEIVFSSPEAQVSIATLDVNHDGNPDLVVEKAFSHKRLQVFLNDGHGNFYRTRYSFPASDDSVPQSHSGDNRGNAAVVLLAISRGFELASISTMLRRKNFAEAFSYWPEALLNLIAARAPSKPRAPPSFLPL